MWIGVDLDGTLAKRVPWDSSEPIGPPIPEMLQNVQIWLSEGYEVRIFTARAYPPSERKSQRVRRVEDWLRENLGRSLEVTCVKDPQMLVLYDDRARQVVVDTGKIVGGGHER